MAYSTDRKLARLQATKDAATWLNNDNAVIVDTETTGLETDDEIIEIAIIDMSGAVLYDSLVKPLFAEVSEGALRVNPLFRVDSLDMAPSWDEVLPEIERILENKTVIAYNAKFDSRLIRQTCRIHKLKPPTIRRWECAMLAYAAFEAQWNESKGDWKWLKLPGGNHTALGDCQATLRLLNSMVNSYEESVKYSEVYGFIPNSEPAEIYREPDFLKIAFGLLVIMTCLLLLSRCHL